MHLSRVFCLHLLVDAMLEFIQNTTRPKPVEHGYVFSIAVGSIGEWLKLVPFVRGRTVDWGGGAGIFFWP